MSQFCEKHPSVSSEIGLVLENRQIARQTFLLRMNAPTIAPLVKPGQFVMLRLPNRSDPLLGRPLAVYNTTEDGSVEVVYVVVGKMTSRLATVKIDEDVEIWGPLGNGFRTDDAGRLIMVAGGVGQTPMRLLAEKFIAEHGVGSAILLYGARNEDRFSCVEDIRNTGAEVMLATDDGSCGYHGPVTDLIPKTVAEMRGGTAKIVCCGPHPMLRSAFLEAKKLGLPCEVSLESPMACGLGICFSCVVELKSTDGSETWDYARTCCDGPVFDAYRLRWD